MSEQTKRRWGIAVRVAVVLAIVVFVVCNYERLRSVDVAAIAEKAGGSVAAAVIVLGIYLLKAFVFVIPASVFYVAVGVAFAPLPAVLVNCAGVFIELTATWLLGRFLGGERVERKLKGTKYGEKIMTLRDKKLGAIFVVRALPVFPIDFVSLFLGASNMGYGKYILVSFFGVAPRVVLFTLLGEWALTWIPYEFMIWFAIGAVLLAAIVALVKYVRKK